MTEVLSESTVIFQREMGPSVLTKGVQGVQYSGFSSARGRRSRYSGFSSVRARVNVPFIEDRKKKKSLLELFVWFGFVGRVYRSLLTLKTSQIQICFN